MKKILITGCGGLIGRESAEFFLNLGYDVLGIDNNMRSYFFGEEGSILNNISYLTNFDRFSLFDIDIRNYDELSKVFQEYSSDIYCIIHTAAQPSHDWATKEPITDFSINSTATLYLLELAKKFCPETVFIYTSTNKVYGDNPNFLPLSENMSRYDLESNHKYFEGIDEQFSIDNTKHSLFGCSKLSGDLYVQEYGKYFGIKTTVFRGGCLTGSKHKGAELHGFLNYLVKCNLQNKTYNIYGYKGKQVRDNIHSYDLVRAFDQVLKNPMVGEVYNIGGGRHSNCSILEAIDIIENITGKKTITNYVDQNRIGDHKWWISDTSKFQRHYPDWTYTYNIHSIISEIIENV